LLNEISGCVSPVGFLLGEEKAIHHKWYVFGLSYEKDDRLLQQKLRVLLVEENDLKLVGSGKIIPHFDTEYVRSILLIICALSNSVYVGIL
jgi:hypothetical protein